MPHLVSGMNFLKNFSKPFMMNLCDCDIIFLSPVHYHHHHHHHHFHYASLHLSSTPDSKLAFSTNPSHHSLPHLCGRLSRIFMTISGLNCLSVFCFFLFLPYLFDTCDRLSWFNQLFNCTLNSCSFFSFPLFLWLICGRISRHFRNLFQRHTLLAIIYGTEWWSHAAVNLNNGCCDNWTALSACSTVVSHICDRCLWWDRSVCIITSGSSSSIIISIIMYILWTNKIKLKLKYKKVNCVVMNVCGILAKFFVTFFNFRILAWSF